MNAHRRAAPLAWLTMLVALASGTGRDGGLDFLPVPLPAAAQTAAAPTATAAAIPTPAQSPARLGAGGGLTGTDAGVPTSDAATATSGIGQAFPVAVAAAGWARVALEPATRARMAPDGHDLRVMDPSGAAVPYVVQSAALAAPDAEVAVRLVGVEEAAAGWVLRFDAERDLVVRRFRFEIQEAMAVTGVRLEGSADGAEWTVLAEGDVFRIGSSADLARTTLDADVGAGGAAVRYLRLHWPRAGGYPRVAAAAVLPWPARPAENGVDLIAEQVESAPGVAVYDIALPGPGLRLDRVEVGWEGAGGVAYRLLRPAAGAWEVLREGEATRPGGGPATLAIQLPGVPLGVAFLRLELDAGGTAPVAATSARGWSAAEWIVFYAAAAGVHRVEYGRLGMAPPPALRGAPPADLAAIPELSAGPVEPLPPADLPVAALAPGADLPAAATFAASWSVVAGGAPPAIAPGDIVRLVLPDDSYAVASPDGGDVRVAFDAGDGRPARQVPFVRWSLPVPVLAAEAAGLVPTPAAAEGTSTVVFDLPAWDVPYTTLDLASPAAVFRRQVDVFVVDPAPLSPVDERRLVTSTVWGCPGAGRAPCRDTLALRAPVVRTAGGSPTRAAPSGAVAKPRLEVVIHDGDDAPLPRVDARVWRRQDALAFAWPAGNGDVRLVAGAPGLAAPTYDIEAIRADVIARVTRDVQATPSPVDAGADTLWARLRANARGLLVGALGVAAVGLLWLLARMLRSSGAPAS